MGLCGPYPVKATVPVNNWAVPPHYNTKLYKIFSSVDHMGCSACHKKKKNRTVWIYDCISNRYFISLDIKETFPATAGVYK